MICLDVPHATAHAGFMVYAASCRTCGPLEVRRPIAPTGLVCATCCGELFATCELDTIEDPAKYPLDCPACNTLSNTGVRVASARSLKKLSKVHAVDRRLGQLMLASRRFGDHREYAAANSAQDRFHRDRRDRLVSSALRSIGNDWEAVQPDSEK